MFVVFEGIDGSGKTTLSNMVANRLRESGLAVKHLRADGKFASSVTEALRDLGRDARNLHLTREAEFFLYVARDVQLIAEVMKPALAETDVVIADRFLFTAEVLGRCGRHLPESLTAPVLQAAALGIVPDLVVLVDVDPSLARARRKTAKLVANDKRPPSRKGLAGVGLQHRVRRGYLELAARDPERWCVIDNEGTLEDTMARLSVLVEDARKNGTPGAIARFKASAPRPSTAAAAARTPEQALSALLDWVDRRAEREPRTAAYLLAGLSGPGVDERRRALAERAPEVILSGLAGLSDDVSWGLRDALLEAHPQAVARTLSGLGSLPRAVAMREALADRALAEVVNSLSRLMDDPGSWALRERAFERFPDVLVGSLGGVVGERAWALRDRWFAKAPELSSSYEASRTAARSVASLPDDKAWKWRDKARVAAPVAALASIGTLLDERSFRLRQEFVERAPKVVMETLRRVDDPRAWALRAAVVADCKEVIDSIHSMDTEQAWAMREAYQDVWPSTVAKSLGPHADAARGKALLLRQLEKFPRNLSLLKHAASVALGLHRRPEQGTSAQ
jgi:dTMP kinase